MSTESAEATIPSRPTIGGAGETEDEPSQLARAVKQIEFYFADANLPFDKFMWNLHTASEEHWVPISTVTSFKRMKEFASIGVEGISQALRELSQDLEVDETSTLVRRKHEVQEPKGQFERSVYAKGFGTEEPGLQQKLEKFFNKYGQTNAVRMRRIDKTKEFKGSVFVEFADFKSVDTFLNADPKPTWSGSELLIMSKEAYCDMKIKEKGLTGRAAVNRKDLISTRKGFNAFKEMERQKKGPSQDKKQQQKPKPEIWLEFMGNKIRVHEEDGSGIVKREEVPFVKGGTLKFTGCGGDVKFDQIKDPLRERFSRAPYIQYSRGDDWGLLGFDKSLTEEETDFVKENVKTINGKDVTWTIPPDEEEIEFQYNRANFAAGKVYGASQTKAGGGRGGKGHSGRGGRRGGRGGGRGSRESKPASTSAEGGDEQTGEKRKRAVEPDGGPDVGVRGQAVPLIRNTSKKAKTDDDL